MAVLQDTTAPKLALLASGWQASSSPQHASSIEHACTHRLQTKVLHVKAGTRASSTGALPVSLVATDRLGLQERHKANKHAKTPQKTELQRQTLPNTTAGARILGDGMAAHVLESKDA